MAESTTSYEFKDTNGNIIWKSTESPHDSVTEKLNWFDNLFLKRKIICRYLNALDEACSACPSELSSTTKEYQKQNGNTQTSNPPLEKETVIKVALGDKLNHYEKLSKCFIEMQRNIARIVVAICATIVICVTIVCCLFSPRINTQGYQTSTSAAVISTLNDTTQTVESTVTIGSEFKIGNN